MTELEKRKLTNVKTVKPNNLVFEKETLAKQPAFTTYLEDIKTLKQNFINPEINHVPKGKINVKLTIQ